MAWRAGFARCWRWPLALIVAACAPQSDGSTTGVDLARARFIDLSHTYDASTVYWPTSPSRFRLDTLAFGDQPAGYFYSAFAFSTPEHGGTHLDAPIHFAAGAQTSDQIPLDRLIARAVVIDITQQAGADRDYRLTPADIEAWEQANGPVPANSIVLLRTGWSERWPNRLEYLGDDTPGSASNLHFPSYGVDAARLLVEQRGVAGLGADVASIDYGPSTDFAVHRIAAARNVIGLENLTNLSQLPATGAWILALPVKIGGGSGGPLRAVGVVPAT